MKMESKTENPPPAEAGRSSAETQITTLYGLLGDRVPSIAYIPHWAAWVCQGDIPPTQFGTLEAYLDEFPLLVKVSADCIVVTDPGFGMGAMEWVFRLFPLEDGGHLAALTEVDSHTDNQECKIWIGKYADHAWEELTDEVLPPIERANFFTNSDDPGILEEYELVNLLYELPRSGWELRIHPLPNHALECIDGHVASQDLEEGAEERICRAWDHYNASPLIARFDPRQGRFVIQNASESA